MKILIAGGNGEVGSDLSYFLSKHFQVFSSYRRKKKILKKLNGSKLILKIKSL